VIHFVLSPEIEDRDEVEVATGRSAKRFSTLTDTYILFYTQYGEDPTDKANKVSIKVKKSEMVN
jgi:hypothetical protein